MNDLLMRLSALDFAALDTQLYLDTHTNDRKATENYNMYLNDAAKLRRQYEAEYGPLTSFRSPASGDKYAWAAGLFPWEQQFND
jgi:spore coat protein JB